MAGFRGYQGLSRRDMFALEAMKVLLPLYADNLDAVVAKAFEAASGMVSMLDAVSPGGEGFSVASEFDSPQAVTDAVLGKSSVSVDVPGVDMDQIEKEFL
jgi:hypothetical protein